MILLLKFGIALAAALAVGGFIRLLIRPTGPWSQFWTVFLVLFLSAWGAGIWMTPLETEEWGWSIPIFAAVGFGVAILLVLAGYPLHVPQANVPTQQRREAESIQKVLQWPFWILIALLGLVIALRYVA
jgi:hypothetical protein